jgi:hypothetical protein
MKRRLGGSRKGIWQIIYEKIIEQVYTMSILHMSACRLRSCVVGDAWTACAGNSWKINVNADTVSSSHVRGERWHVVRVYSRPGAAVDSRTPRILSLSSMFTAKTAQ